jgi:hypothetical protein
MFPRALVIVLLGLIGAFVCADASEPRKAPVQSAMELSLKRQTVKGVAVQMLMMAKQFPDQATAMLSSDGNVLRIPEASDELNQLIRDFHATTQQADTPERRQRQDLLLQQIDRVPILLEDAEALRAKREANPLNDGAPAGNGQPKPAAKPAEPMLDFQTLTSPNLEKTLDGYAMPEKLENEDARRLIRMTDNLPARLEKIMTNTGRYRDLVDGLTSEPMIARFWNRVVNQEGFKDPTLAADWSGVTLQNMGFLVALENLLEIGGKGVRSFYALYRIREIKVSIVGGRLLRGHRRFIESMDHWATITEERLSQDIAFMSALKDRCVKEGLMQESR